MAESVTAPRRFRPAAVRRFWPMALAAPDAGRYIVAAGWFAHGLWDLVHLKLDKVVLRSYAQWCAVVDIIIAAQLAFVL